MRALTARQQRLARLLDLNAPIEHREGVEQWTPLMIAALEGHIEVVTLLTNRGSDLEARNTNGQTALMKASFEGHLAVVQVLVERKLKRKAEIETRSNKGSNALMYASQCGHLAVVQYLASKGYFDLG
jgi:ankyrin repeat protein